MSGLSRIIAVGGCLLSLFAASAGAQTAEDLRRKAEEEQLGKLVGRWEVVGLRCEGKTTQPKDYTVVIQKEKVNNLDTYTITIYKAKAEDRKMRIVQLNPLQLPAWIDLEVTGGDFKGTQIYGVYELSERTLFIGLPLGQNTARSRVPDLSGGVGSDSLRLELSRLPDK